MNIHADKLASALKLATRNAMSPGIVYATLIGIACISAATISKSPLVVIWLLCVFTILTLGTFGVFVMHSIRNPALLQSEDYLLKRDAITIYGSSSYDGEQIVDLVADRVTDRTKKIAEGDATHD